MAPVLKCPDCGTKHPLAQVPDAGTFACEGCGRMLKVPAFAPGSARAAASAAAATAAPSAPAPPPGPVPPPPAATAAATVANARATPVPERTRAMPVVTREEQPPGGASPARAATGPAPVRWWMSLLLWIVAVPLSFLVVFLLARTIGVFSTDQLSDVFLANGASRFWPVVRLLPVIALLTAGIVQGGVLLLSRRNVGQGGGRRR